MGRLIPSSTSLILKEKDSWAEYKKALRKEDKEIFEQLFLYAKYHSPAIGQSNKFYPIEAILISMLIELKKEINSLKKEIETLKNGN
jgi:hypothetical protein